MSRSGGELQKIAIIRALVQEPKVLLLDEPTSNLDLKNQVEILTVIARVVREHDIAAVMTMHDLNQALRFSDTFIFLKDGTVHLFGTGDDVTPDVIEEVYGIPVIIGELGGVRCIVPEHCRVDNSAVPACKMTPYDHKGESLLSPPLRPD